MKMELRDGAGIDPGDGPEELQGILFFSLEGVPANDRSKAASVANRPDFLEDGLVVFLGRPPEKITMRRPSKAD